MRKLTNVEEELRSNVEHYAGMKAGVGIISSIHSYWNDCFLEDAFEKFSEAIDELMDAIESQEALEVALIIKHEGDVPHEVWESEHEEK